MNRVVGYHRPQDLDEAVRLLDGAHRVPLGGGTLVNTRRWDHPVEVVDLQALGLDGIDAGTGRIGAMTRLQDVADDDALPALLRDLARRELPSTLRTVATVGGTVASAGPDSLLTAALVAHDAVVEFHGTDPEPLPDVLRHGVGHRLVTGLRFDPGGTGAHHATGRTPADVPIVAAVGRDARTRRCVVLTGVASTPVEVDPADPVAGLDPPGDFRGSSGYRLHLAAVLTARVVDTLDTLEARETMSESSP